jgi:pyruvate/2-oxoglutarate dehydrogenase complex dihydrolipoamide acyltransferase (E2) component
MTTRKSIVEIMAATNGSEQETQVALARYDQSNEEGRAALLTELSKRKTTAEPEPEPEPEPEDKTMNQGKNKGDAPTVKATTAARDLAEKNGIDLAKVEAGADGKVDVKEVKAAIAAAKNG